MVQQAKQKIVSKFAENDILLTSHGFERIIEHDLAVNEVIKKAKEKRQWLVSNEFLVEFIEQKNGESKASSKDTGKKETGEKEPAGSTGKETPATPAAKKEPPAAKKDKTDSTPVPEEKDGLLIECPGKKEPTQLPNLTYGMGGTIYAKEIESQLKIKKESDVTGKSTCEGVLEDFVDYFNEKYRNMHAIIKQRSNYSGAVPIDVLKKYKGEKMQIVGIVNEKTESKNGFKFLDIEDPSGDIRVLIPKDKDELNNLYMNILTDQVIGIEGKLANELFIASDIVEPDIPLNHNTHYANEPVNAVLMSDIHVGSNLFLEKEFNRFLDWLNLKRNELETAEKVKYLIVAGDLVDGIGIYPGQENELVIPDIYKQYDYLANLLENVPDYIDVVLSMGNHDAVRGADPQPALSEEIGGRLYEIDNIKVTGNPLTISMHGVNTLVYHGTSIDSIIANLSHCSYSKPETAMIEYLKKRHLAPMYGNDRMAPEKKDYMAINDVPDIFHAGHVHKNGYANYRNVKVINSGTWQARTSYQEEQGHMPSPARVPVVNLQNHEIKVMHFGEE